MEANAFWTIGCEVSSSPRASITELTTAPRPETGGAFAGQERKGSSFVKMTHRLSFPASEPSTTHARIGTEVETTRPFSLKSENLRDVPIIQRDALQIIPPGCRGPLRNKQNATRSISNEFFNHLAEKRKRRIEPQL